MLNIYDLRKDFTLKELDEMQLPQSPVEAFEIWFQEAMQSQVNEPGAMNLATVNSEGSPSSRIVLLKEIKPDGFVFFTNYDSKKAKHLAQNPHCTLNFVWHELERQVRIEGIAEKIAPEESDKYFEVRPEKSKLGAWTSPQSEVIPNREYLEVMYGQFEKIFENKPVVRPGNWGGYIVKPSLFEFWQGRSNRLHDRIQYRLENQIWIKERLAP
ncbi:MAG: pyridoxamine 5'-phosphate oxidase [Dysgonamonadaceae bacterium]